MTEERHPLVQKMIDICEEATITVNGELMKLSEADKAIIVPACILMQSMGASEQDILEFIKRRKTT